MKAKITTMIENAKDMNKNTYEELLKHASLNISSMRAFTAEVFLKQNSPVCHITAIPDIEYDSYDKMYYAKWNVHVKGDICQSCEKADEKEALSTISLALDKVKDMESILKRQKMAESLPSFHDFMKKCERSKKQHNGFYPISVVYNDRISAFEELYNVQMQLKNPQTHHFYITEESEGCCIVMTDLPEEAFTDVLDADITSPEWQDEMEL